MDKSDMDDWMQASANDILSQLGEMSDEEYRYYRDLLNR